MTAAFSMNSRILDFFATLSLEHGVKYDMANFVPEMHVGFDTDGWALTIYVPGHNMFEAIDRPTLEHAVQEALEFFGRDMALIRGGCPDHHPFMA